MTDEELEDVRKNMLAVRRDQPSEGDDQSKDAVSEAQRIRDEKEEKMKHTFSNLRRRQMAGLGADAEGDAGRGPVPPERKITLQPKSFDPSGLHGASLDSDGEIAPVSSKDIVPWVWDIVSTYTNSKRAIEDGKFAADTLAIAIMGLDVPAMRHLIYDIGVPVNIPNAGDSGRFPMHYVATADTHFDGSQKSFVYALLKGMQKHMAALRI
jgi:hypothetical protein